jgi:tagaturonate reductase
MTKYRTRILPQLLAGQKATGKLPARLTFALAALIAFYRAERQGESYPVQDDAHWLERYQQLWTQHHDKQISTSELVKSVLSVSEHWEQDLTQVNGLVEQVTLDLDAILHQGCVSGKTALLRPETLILSGQTEGNSTFGLSLYLNKFSYNILFTAF